jgi:Escherichia/Staphylococcus phage prohead protease
MEKEIRAFPVELRVAADGESKKLVGHAAVFDQLSSDLGGFREKVAPGAFADAVEGDVRALWNHDPNFVLGRTKSGTLRLNEDPTGLAIEVDPPDTQAARDLMTSIGRGDVDQMSFAFRTIKDSWETTNGGEVRTLEKVELLDVSPVTFPAYPQTDVAVRSHDAWKEAQKPKDDTASRELMELRQAVAEALTIQADDA